MYHRLSRLFFVIRFLTPFDKDPTPLLCTYAYAYLWSNGQGGLPGTGFNWKCIPNKARTRKTLPISPP